MKTQKIILSSLFILSMCLSTISFAQLKVQSSNGHVGLGTLSPITKLHVVGDYATFSSSGGYPTSAAFIRCNNNYSGPTTPEYTWFGSDQTGVYHPSANGIGFSLGGVRSLLLTNSSTNYSAIFSTSATPTSAAFIRCLSNYSGQTNPDYTWYGADQTGFFHPSANAIGVTLAGTEYARFTTTGSYRMIVNGSGQYSGVWVNSDKRFKKNINTIDKALDKVLKLNGVNYEYNTAEYKSYNFDEGKTLGFIAQELKEVVPEVVKADEKGFYAVNYSAIIPLLVEAFKEQNKKIEDLQQQVQLLSNANGNASNGTVNSQNGAVNNSQNVGQGSTAMLYQNAPNPFNNETKIKFFLPSNVKTANLYIYDKDGNKKKSVIIEQRGEGELKIAANELGQGIYFYSLILDGVIFDSKTMLITQ